MLTPVSIIGGNVAGLSAAYYLSLKGCPVRVYETKIWDKPCGGAITFEFAKYLETKVGISLKTHPANPKQIRFGFQKGRHINTDPIFTIISRKDLQAQLIESLKQKHNTDFILKRISLKDRDQLSNQIILATGFSGFTKQVLGDQWHQREYLIALKYQGVSGDICRMGSHLMVFDSHLKGYGWVFIEGEKTYNIGIGGMTESSFLHKKLADFLEHIRLYYQYPEDTVLGTPQVWKIPIITKNWESPVSFFYAEKEFIGIGDVLGLAHPVIAAGIEPAWQSGWLLAECYDPSTHRVDTNRYRHLLKMNLKLTSRKPIDIFVSQMLRSRFFPFKDEISFFLLNLSKRHVIDNLKRYPWFAMVHDGTRKTGFKI